MPPKKPPSGAGKRAGEASRKKPSTRKPAPKKTSGRSPPTRRSPASARRRGSPAVTTPVVRRRSWKLTLLAEAAPVVSGVCIGLVIAGFFLWSQAQHDVRAYLADPPRTLPGVVYSAPMEVRPGQAVTVGALAGELLAAGYERVGTVDGPMQFAVVGDTFDVWSQGGDTPSGAVPSGRVSFRVVGDRVKSDARVILHPTALAAVGDLEGRRTDVRLQDLSPWLEKAILTMEDSRFRDHAGIDPFGIARAIVSNLVAGGNMQGGSTLTQQLAKNLFLTQERTVKRKVREAFFAAALESELDKDALLELYLGEVYLGQLGGVPIHGVEQAARAWFGVSAGRVSLAQAATIAGVITAPNRYSPVRHPERATERRDLVLRRMVELGQVEEAQAEEARRTRLVVGGSLPGVARRAPWAVDMAIDAAEDTVGIGKIAASGYQLHTSIQPLLQRAAEQAVAEGMAELDRNYPKAAGAQVALVAVRASDGAVVAMVGGRDYATSPFNRATHAWRQSGSTVKPLTLLAAMDADPSLTPISRLDDEPLTLRYDGTTWSPTNYDGRFVGEITVRNAIEASRNVPAVRLAQRVGFAQLQGFYRHAGLSRSTALPSASLGAFPTTPLELAGAYTVFPGGGTAAQPWVVAGIHDAADAPVSDYTPDHRTVSSARAAALTTNILEGVISDGTGARVRSYGVTGLVGGKTGTTDDYRDAWFVGFTPELVVAVWVGRDRSGTVGLSGSRAAIPTWARFVAAAGAQRGELPRPDGIVGVDICAESEHAARPSCPVIYTELFAADATPGEKCDLHGRPIFDVGPTLSNLFRKRRHRDGAEIP